MQRTIIKPILTATVLASTLCFGNFTNAEPSSPVAENADVDYSKAFNEMISRLDKFLKTSKRTLFGIDMEIPKLAKRAEMAGYRVTAALERFNKQKEALERAQSAKEPETELNKIRGKMDRERSLLSKDAAKLSEILERADQMRAEMDKMLPELKRLSDDVAIEADRFEPEDPRQKKVAQLLADTEWANAKIDELKEASLASLTDPAAEAVNKAKVN